MDWEEVKDLKTLSKVKSVEEMLPKPAKNQITKWINAKIWEEQYRIIEETLMMDGTIEEACMLAWITVPTYYNHKNSNPEFARRVAIARQFPKLIARAAVQRRIRQWDAKTALRFLELRDKRYKAEPVLEGWEENAAPVVQFISVPSDEWANNTTNQDYQTSTKQNSAYEWSVSSWEKMTPWENEEEALRRLDSLSSSNG
jgi:hypothetical protein